MSCLCATLRFGIEPSGLLGQLVYCYLSNVGVHLVLMLL
jgi:hypothetical protein